MSALDEAKHAPAVAAFVREFNARCSPHVKVKQLWVRVVPPVQADFDANKQDARWLPFLRVGSLGEVVDVTQGYVTIKIGGNSLMFAREAFLGTFVRAVAGSEWHQ